MANKSKLLRIVERNKVKLPKAFVAEASFGMKNVVLDYNAGRGIGVMTTNPRVRQTYTEEIRDLLNGVSHEPKTVTDPKALKPIDVIATDALKDFIEYTCGEKIDETDTPVEELATKIVELIQDAANETSHPTTILSGQVSSISRNLGNIENAFNAMKDAFTENPEDEDVPDPKDVPEEFDGTANTVRWDKVVERHPEISDKIEKNMAVFVSERNKAVARVTFADLNVNRTEIQTVGDMNAHQFFMLDGDLYVKYSNGSIINVYTAKPILDILCERNYKGIADMNKKEAPQFIKSLPVVEVWPVTYSGDSFVHNGGGRYARGYEIGADGVTKTPYEFYAEFVPIEDEVYGNLISVAETDDPDSEHAPWYDPLAATRAKFEEFEKCSDCDGCDCGCCNDECADEDIPDGFGPDDEEDV